MGRFDERLKERFEQSTTTTASFNSSGAIKQRRFASFLRNEDGSLIIFSLFIFVLMLIVGGMAVDLMQFETTRTKLQNTTDRAVLAAADLDQTLDPKSVVIEYFTKAGLERFLDEDSIQVTGGITKRTVTVTTHAVMPTMFLNMIGINSLNVPAHGSAQEAVKDVEVSLVLDVSGSMGWTSSTSGNIKLDELRKAAKEFGYTLLCRPEDPSRVGPCTVEPGDVSISIVPYSEQVTVGPTLLSYYNVSTEHTSSTCVDFEPEDFTTLPIFPSQALIRTGHFDPWRSSNSTPRSWTCKTEASREIRPYLSTHSQVDDVIESLFASGNTSTDLGMKWGAALLDPSTRPIIEDLATGGGLPVRSSFAERPFDYTRPDTSKFIVLMTDGVNTHQHYLKPEFRAGFSDVWENTDKDSNSERMSIYYPYRSGSDKYYWVHSNQWRSTPYGNASNSCTFGESNCKAQELTFPELWALKTTRWYDSRPGKGNPVQYFNTANKDAKLDAICTAFKRNKKSIIFTIGFEMDPIVPGEPNILEECASSPGHYFPVDGLELSEAFTVIARQINRLRLTQ